MSADDETLAVYGREAARYNDLVGIAAPDRDLQAFIDLLRPGDRVLDLGCGPGNWAGMMADAGLTVDAWDPVPDMVALADRDGVNARIAGFDDLDADAVYAGVFANFSLLHATRTDLPRHLAAIRRALVAGGVFHIGMKVGMGARRDPLGRFYIYVTVPELRALLQIAGLRPFATRRGVGRGLAGTYDPFVICLSRAVD